MTSHSRDLETAMNIGYWTGAAIVVVIETALVGLLYLGMRLGMTPWSCS